MSTSFTDDDLLRLALTWLEDWNAPREERENQSVEALAGLIREHLKLPQTPRGREGLRIVLGRPTPERP